MTIPKPTGQLQYNTMGNAPIDGTVIMALCQRKYPEAVYYQDGLWHYWHQPVATVCFPDYWCYVPSETPSDYARTDVATA